MKNRIFRVIGRLVPAIAVVFIVAACSDGAHTPGPVVLPELAKPEIVKFQISKVGGAGEPSSSVTISEGDSVLLEWEVIMKAPEAEGGEVPEGGGVAPKAAEEAPPAGEEGGGAAEAEGAEPVVTLDSEALGIHMEGLPAIGSQTIDDVGVDAVFVLTARQGANVDTREVSATVGGVGEMLEVTFTAKPPEIRMGETSDLCWTISRADATFTVIDSNGMTIASSVEEPKKEGEEAGELTGGDEIVASGKAAEKPEDKKPEGENPEDKKPKEPKEPKPEKGAGVSDCVTVRPTETTTYYLTAVASDTQEVRKDAKVTVTEAIIIEEFEAAAEKKADPTEVTLRWKIKPDTAVVTISGIEGTFKAEDSTTVKITETTTFELTATIPGCETCTQKKSITVELPKVTAIMLTASGDQVIFAGEQAEISWSVTDAKGGVAVPTATVTVKGGEFGDQGSVKESSGKITVSPTETTEYALLAMAPGAEPTVPAVVKIVVRNWKGPGAGDKAVTAVEASLSHPDVVYAGFGGKLDDGDKFSITVGTGDGPYWKSITVPFMDVFTSNGDLKGLLNKDLLREVEYPVNAIAVDPSDTDRVYLSTSGGVLFSKDGGASWTMLVQTLGAYNSYSGSHPSCAGFEQKGWTGWEINALEQVCDIEIGSGGQFIMATDHMVVYLPNGVDAYIKGYDGGGNPNKYSDNQGDWWHGLDGSNVTNGRVNHDLEIAKIDDKEVLFVGTSGGILKSVDMGETYEALSGAGAPTGAVYSVDVDADAGRLYAGGADGKVYICKLSGLNCTEWTGAAPSGSQAVYGIATDPVKAGGLFAATGGGIFYSADGSAWKNVTSTPMDSGVVVRSIAAAKSEDGKKGSIYAGTSKGVFISTSDVIRWSAKQLPETPEEIPTTPSTTAPTVGGATGVNANML